VDLVKNELRLLQTANQIIIESFNFHDVRNVRTNEVYSALFNYLDNNQDYSLNILQKLVLGIEYQQNFVPTTWFPQRGVNK
jgi:hypothetical protein